MSCACFVGQPIGGWVACGVGSGGCGVHLHAGVLGHAMRRGGQAVALLSHPQHTPVHPVVARRKHHHRQQHHKAQEHQRRLHALVRRRAVPLRCHKSLGCCHNRTRCNVHAKRALPATAGVLPGTLASCRRLGAQGAGCCPAAAAGRGAAAAGVHEASAASADIRGTAQGDRRVVSRSSSCCHQVPASAHGCQAAVRAEKASSSFNGGAGTDQWALRLQALRSR